MAQSPPSRRSHRKAFEQWVLLLASFWNAKASSSCLSSQYSSSSILVEGALRLERSAFCALQGRTR